MQELLTISEAKRALRVSDDTIRRYLKAGHLHGFRLPTGVWRIPESEIKRVTDGDVRGTL